MKKSLILFIVLVLLLLIAKTAYSRYCASKPEGCKQEKVDYEKEGFPEDGVDY